MVEANTPLLKNSAVQGDGVVRNTQYAVFRDDKPASAGYSAELVSNLLNPNFYDDLDGAPHEYSTEQDTILKIFKNSVANRPNGQFLGERRRLDDVNGKPRFGEYMWKTFGEVNQLCVNFARGLMALNLCD